MDPLIGSALIGAGVKGFETLANGFMEQRAAAYNQRMTEKNTAANFMYSQMAQRNAARNEVLGLRAAGLSPVLANGAAGASVAAGSSGTAQAPKMNLDLSNLLLMNQAKLAGAQADKTEADAQAVKLDNANKKGRNATLARNMTRYYKRMADGTSDEELKKFFLEQSDFAANGDFVEGNYEGLLKAFELEGKSEEAVGRKLEKKLYAYIQELRWNKAKGHTMESSNFLNALGSLDARQSELLVEQASKLISEGKHLDKDTELLGDKITLTREQIAQVKAATAQLENTNVTEMFEKGEYGKALLAMLLMVFSGTAKNGLPLN